MITFIFKYFPALKALYDIFDIVQKAMKVRKAAAKEGWLNDGKVLTDAIKNCDSDDKRKALIKSLANHARNFPK